MTLLDLLAAPPKRIIATAAAAWRADVYDAANDRLTDLTGRGHHAQLGSTSGADTNDPKVLSFSGTKYLYLPGAAGNYASSPDSVPLSIVGDLDVRVVVAGDDYTPAGQQTMAAKWTTTGNQRTWAFQLNITTGALFLGYSRDGTEALTATATAVPGHTDGTEHSYRFTRTTADGVIKFFTGSTVDDATTQVGTDVAGTAGDLFNSTALLEIGTHTAGATGPFSGIVKRVQIRSGVDGTIVYDADFSKATEPYATFAEDSANAATVTINRAATGRKSTIVDRPCLLFGVDDYCEVADHADLDFAETDSFTLVMALRTQSAPFALSQTLMAKRTSLSGSAGTTGWGWHFRASNSNHRLTIDDGTATTLDSSPDATNGLATTIAQVRDVAADGIQGWLSGASGNVVNDTTTATFANGEAVRIGRLSGAGTSYAEMVLFGAAIFRRALTRPELIRVAMELGCGA